MMQLVMAYYKTANDALAAGAAIDDLVKLKIRERIGRFKYVEEDGLQKEYDEIIDVLKAETDMLLQKKEGF
jgi:V/A-type H+-transporting ATPase subunit A